MKPESMLLRVVRMSWPLLGGIWGAATGLGGYRPLAQNADSFGAFFANGFFITTAIIGLGAGIICGLVVGGLTEKLLRNLGVWVVCAVCVATMLNALVIWQLTGIVKTKYPGFQSPVLKPKVATKPINKFQTVNPCDQPPPPENSKERTNWDAECR